MRKTSPTPTVGYWAKLAHGKKATRRELSVSDKLPEDREISIFQRAIVEVSEEAVRASAEFRARLAALKSVLVVPEKLSGKLSPAIAEIKRVLLDARVNQDGIVKVGDRYDTEVFIGKSSINRVVRILVAVEQAVKVEGHRILFEKGSIYWEAKGERFRYRINKIRSSNRGLVRSRAQLRMTRPDQH